MSFQEGKRACSKIGNNLHFHFNLDINSSGSVLKADNFVGFFLNTIYNFNT